jgi:hypothetical protein
MEASAAALRRRFLLAGAASVPPLLAAPVVLDEGLSVRGALLFVGIWTALAYATMGLAALDLRSTSSGGRLAFAGGLTVVLLALLLTFAGGFAVAPALCLIMAAASVRLTGRLAAPRFTISVISLLATSAWYVALLLRV